jgi:hypothetical protein
MSDVRFWPKADIPSCTAHEAQMSAFAVAIGGKADVPFCTAYVR